MTDIPSNYTNREAWRVFRRLTDARIEALIDLESKASNLDPDILDDAVAQYPDEGFLSDIRGRILDVAKRTRGENRNDLQSIIDALADLEMVLFYQAEAGIKTIRDYQAEAGIKTIRDYQAEAKA